MANPSHSFITTLSIISLCLSCASSSIPEKKFKNYNLSNYSTFPTASIQLKSNNTGQTKQLNPNDLDKFLTRKDLNKEIHTIEYTEQIKYWSFATTLIGIAGLLSPDSNSKFSMLSLIGLTGLVITPFLQMEQMESLKEKLNTQSLDEGPQTFQKTIKLEPSDFE